MDLVSVLMAQSEDDAKLWIEELTHYDLAEYGQPERLLHPTYEYRGEGIWTVMVPEDEEGDALGIIEDASLDGLAMGKDRDSCEGGEE